LKNWQPVEKGDDFEFEPQLELPVPLFNGRHENGKLVVVSLAVDCVFVNFVPDDLARVWLLAVLACWQVRVSGEPARTNRRKALIESRPNGR
jgi:hypothetical protein